MLSPILTGYVTEITGTELQVTDVEGRFDKNLPLFLRAMYKLHAVVLLKRSLILAVQTSKKEDRTPSEYEGHLHQLRTALQNEDVAFVLPDVPSYVRNRLIQKGIPFIVPGRQMFLPMFLVDCRERFSPRRKAVTTHVSWAGQAVLLHHLLQKPAPNLSLRFLAAETGYSATTLSNVAAELTELDICEMVSSGKSCHLRFRESGQALWEVVEPWCRAPNLRNQWVIARGSIQRSFPAGISALACLTSVNDDAVPTVALHKEEYRKQKQSGELVECRSRQDATTVVECWGYDPTLLAKGATVDKLSLYLSLRDQEDERVRKELRHMMEGIEW